MTLSRAEFARLGQTVVDAASSVLQQALHSMRNANHSTITTTTRSDVGEMTAAAAAVDVDEVVLVGGSSRVPCVQDAVTRTLVKENVRTFKIVKETDDDNGEEEGEGDTDADTYGDEEVNSSHAADATTRSATATAETREFCTSINPDLAVVQGLAVRGAVLMGCDVGLMKDILMLDILPTSIGVMTWSDTSPDTDTDTADQSGAATVADMCMHEPASRQFEAILTRGSRVPATGSKLFTLADPVRQRFVSLDIYEEEVVDDVDGDDVQDTHGDIIFQAAVDGKTAVDSGSASAYDNECTAFSSSKRINRYSNSQSVANRNKRYTLMGTYDLPVPVPVSVACDTSGSNASASMLHNKVLVNFTLDVRGALSFSVSRPVTVTATAVAADTSATNTGSDRYLASRLLNSSDSTRHLKSAAATAAVGRASARSSSEWMMYLLTAYCVVMFLLYVFAKAYLVDISGVYPLNQGEDEVSGVGGAAAVTASQEEM